MGCMRRAPGCAPASSLAAAPSAERGAASAAENAARSPVAAPSAETGAETSAKASLSRVGETASMCCESRAATGVAEAGTVAWAAAASAARSPRPETPRSSDAHRGARLDGSGCLGRSRPGSATAGRGSCAPRRTRRA